MPRSTTSRRQKNAIQAIALEFHRRAFGEEMARVNFLPIGERKKYVSRVRQRKDRPATKRKWAV
jgi:hypothetical protein